MPGVGYDGQLHWLKMRKVAFAYGGFCRSGGFAVEVEFAGMAVLA